jgi:hypothetical protein
MFTILDELTAQSEIKGKSQIANPFNLMADFTDLIVQALETTLPFSKV